LGGVGIAQQPLAGQAVGAHEVLVGQVVEQPLDRALQFDVDRSVGFEVQAVELVVARHVEPLEQRGADGIRGLLAREG